MELAALGGLALIGYYWSKAKKTTAVQHRSKRVSFRKSVKEDDVVTKKFEEAKRPYETGVYANKHIVEDMPAPYFKSKTISQDPKVTYQKLELFTGRDGSAYGGISLKPPKVEVPAIFTPEESRVAVTYSGKGGQVSSDFDRSRYVTSRLHQNVSCTTQQRDVPALKADPLFTYTPYVPHQKVGPHPLPAPATGLATVPKTKARDAEFTRDPMRERIPLRNEPIEGMNALSNYIFPHYDPSKTDRDPGSLMGKPLGQDYFGGPAYAKANVLQQPQETRTCDRALKTDYMGSGIRQFGPTTDLPFPEHSDTRQTFDPLQPGHAAVTSVLPSQKVDMTRFQERPKPNAGLEGTTMRTGLQGQHVPVAPYDEARGRTNGTFELPPNEYTRTTMTNQRATTCMYAKEREQKDPLNHGPPNAAAIPLAKPDRTFVANTECNDRVLVTNPHLHAAVANETLNPGVVENKKLEGAFESSVLQPLALGNPSRLQSADAQSRPYKKVSPENAYLPPAMI